MLTTSLEFPSLASPDAFALAPLKPPTVATSPAVETVRVLHLINGEHYSGAERVQDLLARELPQFGYEVGFACVKPFRFPDGPRNEVGSAGGTADARPVRSARRQETGPPDPRRATTRWSTPTRRVPRWSAGWPRSGPACRSFTTSTAPPATTRRVSFSTPSMPWSNGTACAARTV